MVHYRFGLSVRTWVTLHRSLPSCSYRFFFIEWVKDEVGFSPTCLRPSQACRLGAGQAVMDLRLVMPIIAEWGNLTYLGHMRS